MAETLEAGRIFPKINLLNAGSIIYVDVTAKMIGTLLCPRRRSPQRPSPKTHRGYMPTSNWTVSQDHTHNCEKDNDGLERDSDQIK